MKPFIHKSFIGDFFDVLRTKSHSSAKQGVALMLGGTMRQEAIVSILTGNVDLPEIPQFVASLDKLLTNNVQLIVLDLSRVRYFTPNAAGVLVNFVDSVAGRGKRLILYRPSMTVQNALSLMALSHLFEIQQTEEELLLNLPDQVL